MYLENLHLTLSMTSPMVEVFFSRRAGRFNGNNVMALRKSETFQCIKLNRAGRFNGNNVMALRKRPKIGHFQGR
jgi:uncharacterized protein YcsI (UPF0317 family)